MTFPGAPAVVLGHNARIAWGATNVGPDTQDLFLETVDPADPAATTSSRASRCPSRSGTRRSRSRAGPMSSLDVRSTRHGVVLSDVDKRLAGGPVLSLRWTTTAEVDLALESFFKIDNAANFDEFKAAFDGYGSPSQNFIYADVDGHIGYVLPGLIPIRATAAGPDARPAAASPGVQPGRRHGDRVRDGASGSDEWLGYVPREELPWQLDPAGGQIVSANNAAGRLPVPVLDRRDWDPGYRAARISQLLAAIPGKIGAEDMRTIQMDTYVRRADKMMPARWRRSGRTRRPKTAACSGRRWSTGTAVRRGLGRLRGVHGRRAGAGARDLRRRARAARARLRRLAVRAGRR